jgi:ribonuclease HII
VVDVDELVTVPTRSTSPPTLQHTMALRTGPVPNRDYERALYKCGRQLIAGIDEAGRGCLAGPVVAAAVILPTDGRKLCSLADVRDSKLLTPTERERLYKRIVRIGIVGIGISSHRVIDRYGIAAATRLAMIKAVDRLTLSPDHLLIDALHLPLLDIPQTAIINGDALCLTVAAASIVAKVTRDRIMICAAQRYPGYGFEQHKGYSTPEHRRALARLGPCAIHRRSFSPCVESGYEV